MLILAVCGLVGDMPTRARPSVEQAEYVAECYLRGESTYAIGRELDRSPGWVSDVLRQLGIMRRSRGARPGEANNNWRGTEVGYAAAHARLRRYRGNADHCVECGANDDRAYHWANLTGNYWDTNDYQPMCVPCHRKMDHQMRFSG